METKGKLTVYFEDPFWVGMFEHCEDGKLSVCKVTFGAEPKDYEVYDFVLRYYDELKFSPTVETEVKEKTMNPKQMHRAVRKQLQGTGTGTKSQEALKLQHEQAKTERKIKSREEREAEERHRFALRQQKKKERHKGR